MKKIYFVVFNNGGYSLVKDLSVIPKEIIDWMIEVEDRKYSKEELEALYDNQE
jgi:hypothetical protein